MVPDQKHQSTWPFHTYCVAVGAGQLDHMPVIDWYVEQVQHVMQGQEHYYSDQKQFKYAKIGVVVVLVDCLEKASMLKTSLLGTYGQIASWAAAIEPDVLSDCKKCFKKRK